MGTSTNSWKQRNPNRPPRTLETHVTMWLVSDGSSLLAPHWLNSWIYKHTPNCPLHSSHQWKFQVEADLAILIYGFSISVYLRSPANWWRTDLSMTSQRMGSKTSTCQNTTGNWVSWWDLHPCGMQLWHPKTLCDTGNEPLMACLKTKSQLQLLQMTPRTINHYSFSLILQISIMITCQPVIKHNITINVAPLDMLCCV